MHFVCSVNISFGILLIMLNFCGGCVAYQYLTAKISNLVSVLSFLTTGYFILLFLIPCELLNYYYC